MKISSGLLFWLSFIIGFITSYFIKQSKKYIKINTNISLLKYKFIDTKNKCYIYKMKETNCQKNI
jgi:fructose-specific phosphotransferase system IIC component